MRNNANSFVRSMGLVIVALLPVISVANDQAVPVADSARLRLFGQNGVGVNYYRNSACQGGENVRVSGGLGDAFSSFIGTASNQSIGMPDTPNTRNQAARNGILSKAYFREYQIAAGQPITITMSFKSNPGKRSEYCKTIATTFVPEKGKDYEGALDIVNDSCMQVINELQAGPDGVTLNPVPVALAPACN
jgi:hypothetical protein